MFDKFKNKFAITQRNKVSVENRDFYKSLPLELFALMDTLGGISINNGVYRVHSFEGSMRWSIIIANYFAEFKDRVYPFGFDWMGRQFCQFKEAELLLMFDPSTGEVFKLNQSIESLHNVDFVNDTDDMISANLFNKLLAFLKVGSIGYNECLGYKTPLFLGGKDELANYCLQDMDVYWHINLELYSKIKDLPDGTSIGEIRIE